MASKTLKKYDYSLDKQQMATETVLEANKITVRVLRNTRARSLFNFIGHKSWIARAGKAFLLPFDLLIGLRLQDERFIRYFDKFAGTTVIDLKP